MTATDSTAPSIPSWLTLVWRWSPSVLVLLLFGGAAALQSRAGQVAWWWSAAAVVCACAYAVRERRPVAALALALAVVGSARLPGVEVLDAGFNAVYLLLLFVPVLALFVVSSRWPPHTSWPALAATMVVTVAVAPDPAWSAPSSSTEAAVVQYVLTIGMPALVAVGAWLAGYAVFVRQRFAESLLERAASLERTRVAEAAQAVSEERTRIAQELHDVITHSVAVMVVQAAAADAVWDRDPEQARAALAAVEASGRTVMADLRGMLHTMRADESPAALRRASPGLEQLSALVEQVRTTGLRAELRTSGDLARVTPITALTLLRIAQESVTNALRHAQATTIEIDLAVAAQDVRLSIADDGAGFDTARRSADRLDPDGLGGHGLLGMRERAAAIGARLDIGAGPRGGTIVTVRTAPRQEALT